ncbi:hypothetical protein BGZ60DRAFT_499074 [Tricladium varicosporioides]|nr:hypothetical protein BGZ60DRAFT_499074 [Hymenoscyphus varicosporioides]
MLDPSQSGYLPNHKIDPNVITGGSFGQIWQFKANIPQGSPQDQFYAKPLVYTPSSLGRQVVIAFSEANRIYVLDAINGTLIASRDLSLEGEGPFKVSDLPTCNDIGQNIGITGTPVIDPTTGTAYFWAKSYQISGQSGWQNGAYRFHAVDIPTLVERPGFPTNIHGSKADNDDTRRFTGGTHLQRASLNMVNGVIFAGFGGHCDLFNYTGWIIGMNGTWNGGGGGAGVWQSGSALASDNSGRLFFATGNGKGPTVNQQVPSSGRVHLSTLSECIVNLGIAGNGSLTQQDYFEPATYLGLDAGDRDLGSGGICLPDPSVFSGGGINRLAITCGKSGDCFVTNADNLGGYKMSASGGDAIVQSLSVPGGGSIFGTVGTYPLEGGYLYITPVGNPTFVYSLGFDTSGRPAFTLVGQTAELSPGAVGAGSATITSLNGRAGTALLWITDTNGLRAYQAVPVNGKIVRVNIPTTPGLTKFSRPAFGDGRYYLPTFSGAILAFGAPVAVPLNCTTPVDFGTVSIGSSATVNVTCTPNVGITKVLGLTIEKPTFSALNSSLPQGYLNAGQSFSFPVTFNLTAFVLSSGSTSVSSVTPGVLSTALTLYTNNSVSGYSNQQGVTLTGRAVSESPFLTMNPLQVTLPGIVVGSAGSSNGTSSTFLIQNLGNSNLTILGYAYSDESNGPFINITLGTNTPLDPNGVFSSPNLPVIGSIIIPGGSVTASVIFTTSDVGNHFSILTVFSNGGSAFTILTGTAATVPVALLEQSTNEGGWLTIPHCAIPSQECVYQIDIGTLPSTGSLFKTIRLTNHGGSDLVITKSKPPEGTILGATNPTTDFSESLAIPPGNKSSATVYFQPGSIPLNSDPVVYSGAWTLNTNDLTFGVHVLNFTGSLVPPRVGPLLPSGSAQFKYLGCFQDDANARIETIASNNANNSNGLCQQQALTAKLPFAGTEFQTQCFIGFFIPTTSRQVDESKCTTYTCPGDTSQFCGGNGGFISLYYDSTKYSPSTRSFVGNYTPPSAPPRVGNYMYSGCYTDNAGSRTLGGGNVGNGNTNSLESCAAACKGSAYFGAEFAGECFCGNTLQNFPTLKPDSQCYMLCPGNSSEVCGAGSRLTLYSLNGTVQSSSSSSSVVSSITSSIVSRTSSSTFNSVTATPTSPSVPTLVGNYQYVECHSDNTTTRTLQGGFAGASDMTIEKCASLCTSFTYFGVEYSTECFCGNTLSFGSFNTTDGRCNMLCAGNANEFCGGPNGLTLYQFKSQTTSSVLSSTSSTSLQSTNISSSSSLRISTASSSITPSTSLSSLSTTSLSISLNISTTTTISTSNSSISSSQSSSTISQGSSTLSSSSSTLSSGNSTGSPFSTIVLTTSSLSTSSSVLSSQSFTMTTTTPLSSSSSSSSSISASTSSGSSSFLLQSFTVTSDSSSISSVSSTTLTLSSPSQSSSSVSSQHSSETTSPTSTGIPPTSTASLWAYAGCANDTSANRALGAVYTYNSTMTVESCQTFCLSKNYPLAGLESGNQCFCDLELNFNSSIGRTGCTTPCIGKSSQICGGSRVLSVYNYTNFEYPQIVPSASNYNVAGCFLDSSATRILSGYSFTSTTNMTVESCIGTCQTKGFSKAGVEFAKQCYCGNTVVSNKTVPIEDCKAQFCTGDSTEFCGSANRLLLYST